MSMIRKTLRGIGRALGIASGADAAASAGRVYVERADRLRILPGLARRALGSGDGDGFEPTTDDTRARWEEARRHYGVSNDELARRIRASHDEFVAFAFLALLGAAGAIAAPSVPLTTIGGCFALVCGLYGLKAAIGNYVLRRGHTTTLGAFLRSGDTYPRRQA